MVSKSVDPAMRLAALGDLRQCLEIAQEIGGAAFRADLAGMHHETQYTRLFRS